MRRVSAILLAVCGLLVAGCDEASKGGVPSLNITMQSANRFVIGGRAATRKALPRALKAAGAGVHTRVIIAVAEGTPEAEMAALGKELASAGLQSFAFVRPRRLSVTTGSGGAGGN